MKIRLSIFSHDISYMDHLVNHFNTHYFDKVEISRFTDGQALVDFLRKYGTDVLLIEENMDTSTLSVPGSVSIAYLCEVKKNEEQKGQVLLFKYQKAELIYKRILGLYASEDNGGFEENAKEGIEVKTHLFFSIHGGVGASVVSNAYAQWRAEKKRVLYLNLEVFGDCQDALSGEGDFCLDDVLYALKSRRGSLRLKIESAVRRSREGVYFYTPTKNPLSLLEMTGEEWKRLLDELKGCKLFDEIVLDMDSYPSEWLLISMRAADGIWIVSDESETSASKLLQFQKYMETMERKGNSHTLFKMRLFYNKCKTDRVNPPAGCQMRTAGNCISFAETNKRDVIRRMVGAGVFSEQMLFN